MYTTGYKIVIKLFVLFVFSFKIKVHAIIKKYNDIRLIYDESLKKLI